jgi:hypothetical protein
MSATTAPGSSIYRPRRRALLSVAVAVALALGAGATAMTLTSSDDTTNHQTHRTATLATNIDAQALWNQLSTLSADQSAAIVAGLPPDVRAQLQAIAEDIATAAEHH